MTAAPHFLLNGTPRALDAADAGCSLLRWLRAQGLGGTKEGCADGDCGACTVLLVERTEATAPRLVAVNSCLLPLGLLPGRELLTVEALADGDRLHPVQQALVDCSGSQCGYCTPGFVMSLVAGWHAGELDDRAIEGNLCRCTGYRPIRAAAAQLAALPPADPRLECLLAAAPSAESVGFDRCFTPRTIAAAVALKAQHGDAEWICGATDLGVALSHGAPVPTLIALDRIDALQRLDIAADAVTIGGAVPLARLEAELQGVFPALDTLLAVFAARQVKNRATLGGNLGTASPIGDLLPLLLALDADLILVGPAGERTLPVDGFFIDYRRTRRAADELIAAVRIPRSGLHNAAFKVAKRPTDDISIVAAVFALARDGDGRVTEARLAYGGVAAVPLRARATEALLQGRELDAATVDEARAALQAEFTPLSDHRASADYRRALAGNLFAQFVAGLPA